MNDKILVATGSPVSRAHEPVFREGDRCEACGYWYWQHDGEGWHSLVPITYADNPTRARMTVCPECEALAVTRATPSPPASVSSVSDSGSPS
jgi:hypothetical protein